MELDPLFLKALKLLNSRNKDAIDQLKKLLDDVLGKRKDEYDKKDSGTVRAGKQIEGKAREAEKRDLEKLQEDLAELSQDVQAKKPRLDTGKESKLSRDGQERASGRSSESKESKKAASSEKDRKDTNRDELPDWVREKEKEMEREREERNKEEYTVPKKKEVKRRPVIETSSSDSATEEEEDTKPMDTEDFDLFQGLSCVVCRQMNVTSGNQLVECQECHNLYHQECHRPAVLEKNVNDPRFVWYCSRCARNMNKVVIKPQKSKPIVSTVVKEVVVTKPSKPESTAMLQPFKRVEAKAPSSKDSSSNAGRPLAGLVNLAANLSGKSLVGETSKHTSKSSSHKSHSSTNALFSNPDVMRSAKTESSKSSSKSTESKSSHHKLETLKLSTSNPFVRPELSRSGSVGSKAEATRVPSASAIKAVAAAAKPSSSSMPAISVSGLGLTKTASGTLSAPTTKPGTPPISTAGAGKGHNTAMSADRRLQMMKKKAAAKHLEKRSYK